MRPTVRVFTTEYESLITLPPGDGARLRLPLRLMAPTDRRRAMPVIVGVALGGALGASARYGLDRAIEARSDSVFPWATFVINLSGCFLIGLISAALVDRHHLPAWLRIGLVVGVVGGYTTFSTFAQETLDLNDIHHVGVAFAYVVGSVGLGLVAVYAGTALVRFVYDSRTEK